jgi:hypothetical protein
MNFDDYTFSYSFYHRHGGDVLVYYDVFALDDMVLILGWVVHCSYRIQANEQQALRRLCKMNLSGFDAAVDFARTRASQSDAVLDRHHPLPALRAPGSNRSCAEPDDQDLGRLDHHLSPPLDPHVPS